MRLSHDKIMHLSHLLADALYHTDLLTCLVEKNSLRKEIADTMLEDLHVEDEVDQEVRQILHSYKRSIQEGSREWDVMYHKTFEDQMKKRGKLV
ncbi:hypothetical protein CSB45_08205 [candidate division KSB3 bacterium]|uniref:DUF507 domain-containing protein n=1 Tax=candidate division KSB3 bacterium TaxID=2044937 RepID=A0A2G6E610_9BACT|nr:MAG: hypothetical protein CSB45_08205 [candidate division KSB3 bacterium]PIE29798.1 MAG: hypothetical protein CSA57_07010 [candidate division KSB3 bacterium]